MSGSARVSGFKELAQALQQFPDKVQNNIARSSLRAGMKPFVERIKETIPVDEGDLRDDIQVTTRNRRGVVSAKVKVGAKTAWYAKFVEFGTAAHRIEAEPGKYLVFNGRAYLAVNHPGAKAQPFMRPAFDSQAGAAIRAVAEAMRARLSTKHGIDVPAPLELGDEV